MGSCLPLRVRCPYSSRNPDPNPDPYPNPSPNPNLAGVLLAPSDLLDGEDWVRVKVRVRIRVRVRVRGSVTSRMLPVMSSM